MAYLATQKKNKPVKWNDKTKVKEQDYAVCHLPCETRCGFESNQSHKSCIYHAAQLSFGWEPENQSIK